MSRIGTNDQVARTEFHLFASWTRVANDILGTLSFTLAIAAASTEAPRFFALASMAFVLAAGFRLQRPYRRVYALWREVRHPLVRTRVIWRHYSVFLVGWGSLGLVALGVVTKDGFSLRGLFDWILLLARTLRAMA